METTDFLIIGGGVVGLTMALELQKRHPSAKITLIEKEDFCGFHASGRNSGVLHAGFYYTADSLKAKFTREGNLRWKAYCKEKKIPVNECGKLVVAKNEQELGRLNELLNRGKANGVELHSISSDEAKEIEPRVKTHEKALYSPLTASVNPGEVMKNLAKEAADKNIRIMYGTAYLSKTKNGIKTNKGLIQAGYIINAAGLYADKIAHDFGFAKDLCILPFKGLYLYSDEPSGSVRTNIYPVPDLNYPFLGVHYTITADNHIKIGPTAIPAFWREQYQGFHNFNYDEFLEIAGIETKLFFTNTLDFRKLAFTELKKIWKSHLVRLASELMEGVKKDQFKKWGPSGIRAQLYNKQTKKLEMDFHYEGDRNSFHILNAVSPAFTCALPFAEFLVDKIEYHFKK